MFDLGLSAEQLEFRDTVRDFVEHEVKPAAVASSRLEPFEKPLLVDALDQASRIGLRTLALSESAGGAGADQLTSAIVLEELGAGDVDVASAIALTSYLAHALFDECMSAEQRKRFVADFAEDSRYHLAWARADASNIGWRYHRATQDASPALPVAQTSGNEIAVNGSYSLVLNAPIAKLFAIDVARNGAVDTVLVPRETKGFVVHDAPHAFGGEGAGGKSRTRWYHGTAASITLTNVCVPQSNVVSKRHALSTSRDFLATAAVNLGLGRAAYDTAIEYAKLRVQGGRRIVEHQAIGAILADCAIKLELARNMLWKAAWAADHPEAVSDRSIGDLPLATIARVYTAQAVNEIALGAAECFGAMGVMRDMPLQKYVHDSFIFLHSADHDSATKLEIAERVAGFERAIATEGAV